MQLDTPHLIQYGITALVVGLILALRIRRMSKARPLTLERLWIVPTLYAVLVAALLLQAPPSLGGWALCAAALAIGAGLGWQRGKLMHLSVDPATHQLNQKASLGGLLFIVVLIAVRFIGKAEGSALHLNVMLLTQAFGVMALGLFSAMRVEMYLRGKRLLEQARAAA
ncbi:CcdC protein domain-containing protein [uncultured Sphingomonas sp.]|uniref:CcdC protein domain-containing protein n=1 Tax=uncultured Sphingomonas sp. TaxID=158754 RepID=UPI0025D80188|nr:CcdC protein domain-containing protein [uncultured Sphingomonas sp.]